MVQTIHAFCGKGSKHVWSPELDYSTQAMQMALGRTCSTEACINLGLAGNNVEGFYLAAGSQRQFLQTASPIQAAMDEVGRFFAEVCSIRRHRLLDCCVR